jgi:tripeptidyl-peptidase-2
VYAFTLSQAASVTPRFPHINRRLYEADIQSQLFSLTDTHGQILAQDDGWDPAAIRLGKGDYTVTYHWRHTNVSVLTFLSDLPLTLQGTLSSPQGIRLHDTRRGALNGTGSIGVLTLLSGERLPLHLSTPSPADLPQLPLAAQRLTGVLTLHPEAPQAAARLVYDLPQARATSSPPDHADVQAWRRAQLERRLDTNDTTTFDEDLKRYRHDYPEDIEGDVLALRRADTVEKRRHHHDELVALCDQIVEKLDPLAIALYRGRRASATAPDEAKRWERHFHILTDALYRKCRAIAYHDGQREKAGEAYDDKPFDEAFTALQEWVDTESAPYVLAHIRHHRRQGHWGAALNLLQRHMKEAPPTPLLHKKRVTILESLGWELWSDHESQWNLRRFPSADLTPETANVAKTPSP